MLLLALIIGLENDHENQVAKYLVHMIHMDQMLVPMKKYRMIFTKLISSATQEGTLNLLAMVFLV